MSLTQLLSQFYTQPQSEPTEAAEKVAQVKQFAKLAAERNIDLTQYTPEQIEELYKVAFPTSGTSAPDAATPTATGEVSEEEKRAAAEHFLEKKAFSQKVAEADMMGRVMAHAFDNQLQVIQAERAKTAGQMPPQFMKGKDKDGDNDGDKDKKEGKKEEKSEEEKKAAAFENLAVHHALKLAQAHNYDMDLVGPRVHAIRTLGLQESDKIASVRTPQDAVEVRALEYLEKAGCTVNWNAIFPQG